MHQAWRDAVLSVRFVLCLRAHCSLLTTHCSRISSTTPSNLQEQTTLLTLRTVSL